jgi:hypothetical protein
LTRREGDGKHEVRTWLWIEEKYLGGGRVVFGKRRIPQGEGGMEKKGRSHSWE